MSIHTEPVPQHTPDSHHFTDPFEGITFFDEVDKEQKFEVVTGEPGTRAWQRVTYYPRVGEIYIERQSAGGPQLWNYNVRTGAIEDLEGGGDGPSKIGKNALSMLRSQGVDVHQPKGYPEITAIVDSFSDRTPVPITMMQHGAYYALYQKTNPMVVFQFDTLSEISLNVYQDTLQINRANSTRFGKMGSLRVQENGQVIEGPESSVTAYSRIDKKTHELLETMVIYALSDDEVSIFSSLRPLPEDPVDPDEWSREQCCVYIVLQGLQYERYGKDEWQAVKSAKKMSSREFMAHMVRNFIEDPEIRYQEVTLQNYERSLQTIIDRFGEDVFFQEAQRIMLEHLQHLHTDTQKPGSTYMPHSDIHPLDGDFMELAQQVIIGAHPLPADMTESGHVVNAKTLFGDADFWKFVRTRHPDVFARLVDYIEELPRDFRLDNSDGETIIDPVALIAQYFPDAYKEVVQARPDFVSDTKEAIQIIKSRSSRRK